MKTGMIIASGLGAFLLSVPSQANSNAQPVLGARTIPVINVGGLKFKDLNRNGRLDRYEDWRLSPKVRSADLIRRMTLEEKTGVMMHGSAPTAGSQIGAGDRYDLAAAREMIVGAKVNSFITRLNGNPLVMAEENNRLQEIAEEPRLAIPATISSDPRNAIKSLTGASIQAGGFSRWPDGPGIAATRDPALARRFADVARQEYLAVGIRQALSPQVDIATEPRWSRVTGTFGEDPQLASVMGGAYVAGMQNGETGIGPTSVLAVVKHWVGYGAAKDGWDSHSYYGRFAQFGGDTLGLHVRAFEGALNAKVAGVMPTYSILQGALYNGQKVPEIAGGYNRWLLQDLLRGTHGFRGVVLSDWSITSDCPDWCRDGVAPGQPLKVGGMPWGVEELSKVERFALAVKAGVDQFGGVVDSADLAAAVTSGKVGIARIDESVARILQQKFEQGLFENPYVDPQAAAKFVGSVAFRQAGEDAQRRSLVLLKNERPKLAVAKGARVFLWNIQADVARKHGWTVVDKPADADVSIIRMEAPFDDAHPGFFFGTRQHEGRLSFNQQDKDYRKLLEAAKAGPVIGVVHLERPLLLANVVPYAATIVAHFGVDDGPLLDVLAGQFPIGGKLPFELPSSEDAVLKQRSDLPHDSEKPLFPFGFGLTQ